jgi:vanillate/3-O-methylgallate O-demethylase
VKFDHDFIGREALEKMAKEPHRRKVTFAWNGEDVAKVFASMFVPGRRTTSTSICRCRTTRLRRSTSVMATATRSSVRRCSPAYSYNERSMLSLGFVDPDIKEGSELTLYWGEENGGTKKTTVEPHKQSVTAPAPFRLRFHLPIRLLSR